MGWVVAVITIVAAILFCLWFYNRKCQSDHHEIDVRVAHLKESLEKSWRASYEATLNAELATSRTELEVLKQQKKTISENIEELKRQCDDWASRGRASRLDYESFTSAVGKLRASFVAEQRDRVVESKELATLEMDRISIEMRNWVDELERQKTLKTAAYDEMVAHLRAVQGVRNRAMHNNDDGLLRLRLSDDAIIELRELWAAIKRLRVANPTPLYKAVFELYLRGPVKEISRKAPEGGGIYRITNVVDGKVYVGRTTNFANRWLEHVKRGAHYEEGTTAGSLLYSAMKEEGVWNFTFEALEVADEGFDYGEREKEWIRILSSDQEGYNMRRG